MRKGREGLTIGAFARAAGVCVETIRYYQRKSLLREPEKPYGGIRRYGSADIARLRFIKSAQRLGFTLDEIGQLLTLEDGRHCDEAAEIAAHRLEDVRQRLADLARMENALSMMVQHCRSRRAEVSCPLIAGLQENHAPERGRPDVRP